MIISTSSPSAEIGTGADISRTYTILVTQFVVLIYPISAPLLISSPFSPLFANIVHNSSSSYRPDLILTDPSKYNSGLISLRQQRFYFNNNHGVTNKTNLFIYILTIPAHRHCDDIDNVHDKTTAYSYCFSSAPTILSKPGDWSNG